MFCRMETGIEVCGMQKKWDVLIIEDDVMLQMIMKVQLELNGHSVRVAGSGEQAFEMIKEQLPTALLLDVGLPGLSGLEVVEHLRSNPKTKNLPIVVNTSSELTVGEEAKLAFSRSRLISKSEAYSDNICSVLEGAIEAANNF